MLIIILTQGLFMYVMSVYHGYDHKGIQGRP